MNATAIEWCDATWNPVTGCSPISEGCQNCWAKRMAKRLAGRCGYPADDPFRVMFHPDRLEEPLRMRAPKRIAVSLMGDLFHNEVTVEYIDRVFATMALCPQHTFMLLTKRPENQAGYLRRSTAAANFEHTAQWMVTKGLYRAQVGWERHAAWLCNHWPLPNVWLGVSVENQQTADERIPWLLKCPAAVRYLSMEPLLGPVDLSRSLRCPRDHNGDGDCDQHPHGCPQIDWVIVGGETGPGARPMHPDWARSIRDQCKSTGVPFFFKQWGEWMPLTIGDDPGAANVGWVRSNRDATYTYPSHFVKSPATLLKEGFAYMGRVGKKVAGRLLDDREWNEMPATNSSEAG